MKRLLLLACAITSTISCSTDDATSLIQQPPIQFPQQEVPTEYRMFVVHHTAPLEYYHFKIKNNDGHWIEQELQNESLYVKIGDSINISTGTYYIPDGSVRIGFQLNDYIDEPSNWNTNVNISGDNEPLNISWKVERIIYDYYPPIDPN